MEREEHEHSRLEEEDVGRLLELDLSLDNLDPRSSRVFAEDRDPSISLREGKATSIASSEMEEEESARARSLASSSDIVRDGVLTCPATTTYLPSWLAPTPLNSLPWRGKTN